MSTNLQIFSRRSDILCFIQVMLPVSALDNCIIRAESPLPRGRGRTGDGAWRDIVLDDSLLGGGESQGCSDISDSSQSLSLHVGFQPDLRSSHVSGWPFWLKDTVNQMLRNPTQWNQRYLTQKGWMQNKANHPYDYSRTQ